MDIIARKPNAAGELEARDFRSVMLSIAKDRFRIAFDRSRTRVDGYALVVARKGRLGPALHASAGASYKFDVAPRITLTAQRLRMHDFAEWLKSPLGVGQRVEDQTGLNGEYDLTLKWTPQRLSDQATLSGESPTVFTAMQEQLGLKLRAQKVTAPLYVIKEVRRPDPE